MFTSVSLMSLLRSLVLDLDLDLDLDLELELLWSMSAIWILPLPRVARTLVLELCLCMIASAIQQIVNTDRTELKDFFSEVDKLHKTDEAVTAKIANNPALAKALTDPNWLAVLCLFRLLSLCERLCCRCLLLCL
jgi:hypothetical protein